MAFTDINSEDRLVQKTFADASGAGAWLGKRLCLERGDVRAGRYTGTRGHAARLVLTRDLRAALVRLNPQLPPSAIADAVTGINGPRFHAVRCSSTTRSFTSSSEMACRSITRTPKGACAMLGRG